MALTHRSNRCKMGRRRDLLGKSLILASTDDVKWMGFNDVVDHKMMSRIGEDSLIAPRSEGTPEVLHCMDFQRFS